VAVVRAYYKGAYYKGAYYKGACYKGAYYKGACRKEAYRKGAYCKEGSISSRVGINSKVNIRASSSKDVFRLFRVPLLLYRALSIVYSGGVGKYKGAKRLRGRFEGTI